MKWWRSQNLTTLILQNQLQDVWGLMIVLSFISQEMQVTYAPDEPRSNPCLSSRSDHSRSRWHTHLTVQSFISREQKLENNSCMNWQPVQLAHDRGDVVTLRSQSDDSSHHVLNTLKFMSSLSGSSKRMLLQLSKRDEMNSWNSFSALAWSDRDVFCLFFWWQRMRFYTGC